MIRHQVGLGLVEVLVAMLILAVAILGFTSMQLQAVKLSAEAVDRSQALTIMRALAEKIRSNPTAINTYATELHNVRNNSFDSTLYNANCQSTANSTPALLAKIEVCQVAQQINAVGYTMDMYPCPSSGDETPTNIMYSYCLITAWGTTNPTIGTDADPSDGSMDCLSNKITQTASTPGRSGGTYYPKSTCMFIEAN